VNIFSRLLPPSFDPHRAVVLGLSVAAAVLASCSQNPITVNLHAMQSSGKVSFVCRGDDNRAQGHKLDECPDYESGSRRTIALVTQTFTNEVAVVDLAAQKIADIDPTTPGYSFLRVGGMPGSIVSTPGGAATFVGVTGPEKNGIFALPTTCIMPPDANNPEDFARDLTTWPACHLSSEPGDIAVVVDPTLVANEKQELVPRAACGDDSPAEPPKLEYACKADTTQEAGPVGRRKLLVALPREHKLVLLDAQRLLDQQPGTFTECQPEQTFALDAEIPASYSQKVPEDLQPVAGAMCAAQTYATADMSELPTPAGIAALGDRAYVADSTRSVVHVLDVSDPCAGKELPPLLPLSFEQPWRAVKTSRVAVSPLSSTANNPRGQQFLYAIDQDDQPAASVMVFDLSAVDPKDPDTRTPLIFDGAKRQPYMPADRLRFNAPVQDVSFVLRDFPKPDPTTGAGEFGLLCDPNPSASGPGTLYRPNSDFSDGARPINLRGLFGFAMLTNGQVAVIDAEDFDAPCRRPVTANQGDKEDIHGCKKDDSSTPFVLNGANTVTNESSCHIVEPHRPRSTSLSISSATNGVRAPSLRTFPQFSTPSTTVPVGKQPRMMATDFADPNSKDPSVTLPAQVNVGSQLYANCPKKGKGQPPPCDDESLLTLATNPGDDTAPNSLTLPLAEPRSYAGDQTLQLVYEGPLFPPRTSGFLQVADEKAAQGLLQDRDANFCGAGVEDSDTIRARGVALKIPESSLDAWSKAHADYVQITGDFPAADDQYWTRGRGQFCAGTINPMKSTVAGRDACVAKFGNIDNPAILNTKRNLSILKAETGQLTVTPQGCTGQNCVDTLAQLDCCFPAGTAYTVRASNQWLVTGGGVGTHDIGIGAGNRCVHTASCDRRKEFYGQRVFEVCDPSLPQESHTEVGADGKEHEVKDFKCEKTDPKVGCVGPLPDPTATPPVPLTVTPNGIGHECLFENLTSRFVVYHGEQPNVPNMAFTWQTTGGFVPQSISLLPLTSAASPQSLGYLPEQGWLAVVDSTVGLALFDLNSLGVVLPSPYF